MVSGLGIQLTGPDDLSPRSLITTNDYYGLYLSDTLDLTDRFALTFGGRYNVAHLTLTDQTGNDPFLNGSHTYSRFNPAVGGTYKVMPGLSLYGGYSEANRAPTPAELACADPLNPCLIESFLTGDPPLKQVVSQTWETGLRGQMASWGNRQRVDWSLGVFRTLNIDDIISVAAPTSGRGYFQNAGDTLRQGIEASVSYRAKDVFVYANYSYVDATFRDPLILPSPNTPSTQVFDCPPAPGQPAASDPANCIQVLPGDTLPGVPKHKFKAGFDYWITGKWKLGADLIAASSQVFYGDEANLNPRLGGYAQVNLHSSYDITEHVQVYGLINNLLDARFGTFGNYFDTVAASKASLDTIKFTDPRTVVPSQPFAAYGGVKVRF